MSKKKTEIDNLNEYFKPMQKIFLYGYGANGVKIYNVLKVLGFEQKYHLEIYDKNYDNEMIHNPMELLQKFDDNSFVIITIGEIGISTRIKKILLAAGWALQNIINGNDFLRIYLPFLAACYLNKSYLSSLQLSITGCCNLKCKNCTNFVPYSKPYHRDYKDVCDDVDYLFKKVDYISELPIIGGETFLHQGLAKILTHICENYEHNFGYIHVYTNGTIDISSNAEIIDVLICWREKIRLFISDYSYINPDLKEKVNSFENILIKHKIPYSRNIHMTWNDVGIVSQEEIKRDQMNDFVTMCSQPCRDYEDKKIYYCAVAKYGAKALNIVDENNVLSLEKIENAIELYKFVSGCDVKKIPAICKLCNGYDEFTNPRIVEAGIQL